MSPESGLRRYRRAAPCPAIRAASVGKEEERIDPISNQPALKTGYFSRKSGRLTGLPGTDALAVDQRDNELKHLLSPCALRRAHGFINGKLGIKQSDSGTFAPRSGTFKSSFSGRLLPLATMARASRTYIPARGSEGARARLSVVGGLAPSCRRRGGVAVPRAEVPPGGISGYEKHQRQMLERAGAPFDDSDSDRADLAQGPAVPVPCRDRQFRRAAPPSRAVACRPAADRRQRDRIDASLANARISVVGRNIVEVAFEGDSLTDLAAALGCLTADFDLPLDLDGEQHRLEMHFGAAARPCGQCRGCAARRRGRERAGAGAAARRTP